MNDDFSNLQLMTNAEHTSLHNLTRIYPSGEGCIVDKMIGKCGPYRYRVTKHKGKQTWKYLGRTDRFVNRVGKYSEDTEVGVGKSAEVPL